MSSIAFRFPNWARALGLASLLGLLTCVGCGSGMGPLVPVEGKATVGGRPLTTGNVTFYPEDAGAPKLNIVGTIGPDGAYKMTTSGKAGVPKGKYKVTVNTMASAYSPPPDPSRISATGPGAGSQRKANIKYETPDKTDLTIEVPSASYDLNLAP